ncbi:hypothetical protein GJ496_008193 [Pomphorhynchus laevis]|nr:hypothetical protein GJ496_008193 [Pomphorhynchus laevis]
MFYGFSLSCTSLRELILNHNKLFVLPTSIGFLRTLEVLNADNNNLKTLSPSIGSCVGLRILSLQCNEIEALPDELGYLSKLQILNVVCNKLTVLPYSFVKLRELKALWISENQIKSLPVLQCEKDRLTGNRYLGCYLLPQEQMSNRGNFKKEIKHQLNEDTSVKVLKFAADTKSNPPRVRIPSPNEVHYNVKKKTKRIFIPVNDLPDPFENGSFRPMSDFAKNYNKSFTNHTKDRKYKIRVTKDNWKRDMYEEIQRRIANEASFVQPKSHDTSLSDSEFMRYNRLNRSLNENQFAKREYLC